MDKSKHHVSQNNSKTKYPNYKKLATYLNTFDNPETILQALVALLTSKKEKNSDVITLAELSSSVVEDMIER